MIYFLSDAHLGSRAIDNPEAHQQTLIDMLNSMARDATAIYLLGDIFDFWCEYFWRDRSKEQYRPFLQTLRAITDKGIAVQFFIGNHDIWTFGWLEKETGVVVHRKPQSVVINGKKLFLAHGDGLVPSNYLQQLPQKVQKKIRQFIFLRAVFHNPILQCLFRLIPPALGNAFGYEWAKNSRLKELARPCPYKGEEKEELVLFAKEQEQMGNHHDYYIFGHRHIELDLMLSRDSRIMILGDCWQQFTYAQMDNVELRILNMNSREQQLAAFDRLLTVMDELREKCPWDRKQTFESLRQNTIEETYELATALLQNDMNEISKELGDVLLHVVFYAKIGSEIGAFDMADVCNKICDKLIFRHPHVYGEYAANNAKEVCEMWEQVKLKEKDGNKTVLGGIPEALPALIKAYRIQDKVANVGFDWEKREDVWAKVKEEIAEFEAEVENMDEEKATEEFGDLLFAMVNAARLYKIRPDNALEKTNAKFIRRFNYIEQQAKAKGLSLKDMTLNEMEALWQEAKKHD